MVHYREFYGGDKVKVFISWSGERSCKIAKILKEWMPYIIQDIEPYFSSADIDKGARWNTDISKELELACMGILCVTKENLESPWLNFEAGALSKKFDTARVCPLLFDVKPGEITSKSPISQFQMTVINQKDIYRLFQTINSCLETGALAEERLQKTFDMVWPNIEKEISSIEAYKETTLDKTTKDDTSLLLENILELTRAQHMLLKDPTRLLPEEYLSTIMDTDRSFAISLRKRMPATLVDNMEYLHDKLFVSEMKLNINIIDNEAYYNDENMRYIHEYLEISREIFARLGLIKKRRASGGRMTKKYLD